MIRRTSTLLYEMVRCMNVSEIRTESETLRVSVAAPVADVVHLGLKDKILNSG